MHQLSAVLWPQVIDEMSTDGTPDRLRELGVHVIETKKVQGVTANWNMVRRRLLFYPVSLPLRPDLEAK